MSRPLLLDGPMGTEIDRRGGDTSVPLWSARALIETPELVQQIHLDYIKSGAQIITTNTFRTQQYTVKKARVHSHTAKTLTEIAVVLGRSAIDESGQKVKLAGSIAPIEDCYSPHLVPIDYILKKEHQKMANNLFSSGVDLFLIETMNTIRESKIAVEEVLNYDLPIYLSFTVDKNGIILGGAKWDQIINEFADKVDLLMVNCSSIDGTELAIHAFKDFGLNNWGFYPNIGEIHPVKGWQSDPLGPKYIDKIAKLIEFNPALVGTCCGSTPNETQILWNRIQSLGT